MKNLMKKSWAWKPAVFGVTAAAVVLAVGFAVPPDSDFLFKIDKSIGVFGRVYKEVAANYVDAVDPEKFMQAGIDGMLGTLDPYTTYIDREDGDEVDLMTTGRYGGIGVTIGVREGAVRVISVMDGYSAARAGIVQGDRILKIDTVSVTNKKPDQVRSLTRGEPGTEVRVRIEREGERAPLDFVLIREEIQVKNVTFSSFADNGIAYVRLERFSRKAGDEVRQALRDLRMKGEIRGVVLDLRGNPGGLLDAAVEVVGKFAPRGSLIVSTKGRRTEGDKKYVSTEEPEIPTAPIVVLTDRNSASASEIVSGGLQDLDRALIVGTRTFGKGLVQTIVPLDYGAQLKITTARYYTPSGRSIQEIDYLHKDKGGVFSTVPDSLKREFKTIHGRKVFEAGGITPDSVVKETDTGPMVRELYRKALFFRFANTYVAEHKGTAINGVTEEMLGAFRKYLEAEKFDYHEESEAKVKELRKVGEQSHYSKEVLADLDMLGSALEKEKLRGFDRYKDHIAHELEIELMARVNGEHGRIEASLKEDAPLKAAIGILKDPKLYARKLGA